MSYYYPSLIVGIDGFGRSLVRGVAEDIAGIHGSLLEVLRCVAVLSSALPDPADVDADDRLVSDFAWCETEEAFLAMVGTPDPEATIPIGSKGDVEARRIAHTRFLVGELGSAMSVAVAARLADKGYIRYPQAGLYFANVTVIVDLADDKSRWVLGEVLDALNSAAVELDRACYIHVITKMSEAEGESAEEARAHLEWLAARMREAESRWSGQACYVITGRLSDNSVIGEGDIHAIGRLALWFLSMPFEDNCPLAEMMAAAPGTEEHSERLWVGLNASARLIPIGEVKRRLAYHLGTDILQTSLAADCVDDPSATQSQIAGLPIIAGDLLREQAILEALVSGIPVDLTWQEHPVQLIGLRIRDDQLRQRISDAPPDEWVDLVDNFGHLLSASKVERWEGEMGSNRVRRLGRATSEPEGVDHSIDRMLAETRQPICAAEMLLSEIERVTDDEHHPFRRFRIPVGAADRDARRSKLVKDVALLPTSASYAVRWAFLLGLVGMALSMSVSGAVVAALSAGLAVGIGAGIAWLSWRDRLSGLHRSLEGLIAATTDAHQQRLLAKLQAELSGYDDAIQGLVDANRDALARFRDDALGPVRTHFSDEAAKFGVMDSVFYASVISPDGLLQLYREWKKGNDCGALVPELCKAGLMTGWRAADVRHLRRTLWQFCLARFGDYSVPGGLERYIGDGEAAMCLKDLLERTAPLTIAGEFGSRPGGERNVFTPPGPQWTTAYNANSTLGGTAGPWQYCATALGVLHLHPGHKPRILSDDD